jgi:CoA-transferase family III
VNAPESDVNATAYLTAVGVDPSMPFVPAASLERSGPNRATADMPDVRAGWAGSGAMWLTGDTDGPPLDAPGDIAGHLSAIGTALAVLAPGLVGLDAPALLGERAAIFGLHRQGRVNCGGSAHLLEASDGWVCVNLPRPDDWAMVPAWLECDDAVDGQGDWAGVERGVASRDVGELTERAGLLGLAVSWAASAEAAARDEQARVRSQPFPMRAPVLVATSRDGNPALEPDRRDPPLVVDLSSLWAGPLCGSLLVDAGCRVIKVEDPSRPDGTRRGPGRFFDLMHAGKQSVTLDLRSPVGRNALGELCSRADVVITSARPRALEQLGLLPPPAPIWVAITGYGLTGPWRDRVAFGDDAAIAAGLCAVSPDGDDRPRFCADAIADPVAGLLGALGALALLRTGRSGTVDVALREAAGLLIDAPSDRVRAGADTQQREAGPVARPRARAPRGRGPELGRDTDVVLRELGVTAA